MHGTRRYLNEPLHASCPCRLDQTHGSEHILTHELNHVAFGAAKTVSRPEEGRVNDRIATGNQCRSACGIVELTGNPLDQVGRNFKTSHIKAAAIARHAIGACPVAHGLSCDGEGRERAGGIQFAHTADRLRHSDGGGLACHRDNRNVGACVSYLAVLGWQFLNSLGAFFAERRSNRPVELSRDDEGRTNACDPASAILFDLSLFQRYLCGDRGFSDPILSVRHSPVLGGIVQIRPDVQRVWNRGFTSPRLASWAGPGGAPHLTLSPFRTWRDRPGSGFDRASR